MKIRKGDRVRVLTGKFRGKEGEVMTVLPKDNKVIIDGVPANDIGGGMDIADLATTGVESVEVLRGSNSAACEPPFWTSRKPPKRRGRSPVAA